MIDRAVVKWYPLSPFADKVDLVLYAGRKIAGAFRFTDEKTAFAFSREHFPEVGEPQLMTVC